MFEVKSRGSFDKTLKFLRYVQKGGQFDELDRIGEAGVNALRAATPVDTGETSESWRYRITRKGGRWLVEWYNTHSQDGVNVAVILQYGHATGTGGYVQGIDYINPALRPIFEAAQDQIWKKVTNG